MIQKNIPTLIRSCGAGSLFVFVFSVLLLSLHQDLSGRTPWVQDQKSAKEVENQWKKTGWNFDQGWSPVTDPALAKAWGEGTEQAIKSGDMNKISKFFDFEPVVDRCVAGVTDEQFRVGFMRGLNQGTTNLLNQLSNKDGSYHFRGVRNNEYGACALMRMLDANGGCNYHVWRLQENEQGEIRGVDMYVFLSGESFGDTVRRLTLLSVPKDDRTFFQKLSGTEKAITKNQEKMLKVIQGVQQGQFQTVLESYDELPANLKKEKAFMIMRILAALQVGESEYVQALDEFQKQYPGDASADLAGIDLFFLKQQFDKMHEAIDRLEKSVGKDAHLIRLRAVGFSQEGKIDEAVKALKDSISEEPEMEATYWTMVEICLNNKKFDEVTDTLEKLVKRFGYNEFDFTGNELYAEYLKSDQYAQFEAFLKTIK